ncbi:unnamed protein product [Jaminaea pallidilutea]
MFLNASTSASAVRGSMPAALRQAVVAPSSLRRITSTAHRASSRSSSQFDRPGPPPLPKEEQKEFNRLVKEKSGQLQFNRPPSSSGGSNSSGGSGQKMSGGQDELHPNARRAPQPDFEGDTNPKTGEVGGPKKDPLTWEREWTYGGRASDF